MLPDGRGKWRDEYSETLRGADVVVIGDNDAAGRRHVEQMAANLNGVAGRVRVLEIAKVWPEAGEGDDVSDWLARGGGTADKLKALIDTLPDWQPATVATDDDWPLPKPLPDGLAPVEPFHLDFMPGTLKPWIGDISDRMQCPPDYVGATAIIALGSAIGRRIGLKPQMRDGLGRGPEPVGRLHRPARDAEVARHDGGA